MSNQITTAAEGQPAEFTNPRTGSAQGKLSEARRRLPVNVLSNLTYMALNVVVGFWYTPYLIAHLGVAVYGLIPLASSITNYLSLLTDGFNSAVSRFLQIELARDDTARANRVFNTSVSGALAIFGLIFPIAILISLLAPHVFNVPVGHEHDAQWLVFLTMLAFAVAFIAGSFAVSSFASHRFDLRLYINTICMGLRVGCVVSLFVLLSPRLWIVGLGLLVSQLFALLGDGLLWHRLTPQLKIKLSLFDKLQFKEMLHFSGWVLVNQAGVQLFLNIDLVVANLIFGAYVAGRYGAVIIFSALLRGFVATIASVLDPIVFTLYAQNNPVMLARLCRLSTKFMGLAIALPIGLICGLAKPLLIVWLGPSFSDLSWLVVVLVSHLCVNLAVIPLFPIQTATNHVRVPGILMLVMGFVNAGLAVTLALWSNMGYVGIALAGAIVLTAKNTLFTPFYSARNLKLPWHTFYPSLIIGILGFTAVGLGTYWLSLTWALTSWSKLAQVGISVTGIYVLVAYLFGLSTSEKLLLTNEVRQRIRGLSR